METNQSSATPPVTLITGYRGLAEYFFRKFAEAKHSLSVLVRNERVVEELSNRYPESLFCAGDVTSRPAVMNWMQKTLTKFGRMDCLINNAAITGPAGKLHDISYDEFEQTIRTNLLSPVFVTQQALKVFVEQGRGIVINLSGGGAAYARPHFAGYVTSKCAIVRLTESLALEYPNLRFYAVSPGALKTGMLEGLLKTDREKIGKEYDVIKKSWDTGGDNPEDAANLALWLFQNQPESLSGKLISAVWDDYKNQPLRPAELGWWTLRRVDELCVKRLKTLESTPGIPLTPSETK